MAQIWNLLAELLSLAFRYLHPVDIECLAQDFNKRVYIVCLPFLQDRIACVKCAKRIMKVFNRQSVHDDIDFVFSKGEYDMRSGLANTYGPFSHPPKSPPNPLANVDFLDLRGDLYWLKPIEDLSFDRYYEDDNAMAKITSGLTALIDSATQLGLTIPECFVRLCRTKV
jgi:hypothetical protein